MQILEPTTKPFVTRLKNTYDEYKERELFPNMLPIRSVAQTYLRPKLGHYFWFVYYFGPNLWPPDLSSWENIQLFIENSNPTSKILDLLTQGPKIDRKCSNNILTTYFLRPIFGRRIVWFPNMLPICLLFSVQVSLLARLIISSVLGTARHRRRHWEANFMPITTWAQMKDVHGTDGQRPDSRCVRDFETRAANHRNGFFMQ